MIEECIELATNIDDMDTRLWPHVIDQLLGAGAADAWVTPVVMKKGRPAYTLTALCDQESADRVRRAMFRETTTLGIRERELRRYVLDRIETAVEVDGHRIGVKLGLDPQGTILNRSVEWDDVEAAALKLGRPAKTVLAQAAALAEAFVGAQAGVAWGE